MTDEEARKRVESRKWATDAYYAAEDRTAFVERVIQLGGKSPATPKPIVPMTDVEVKAFMRRPLFFGIHSGTQVMDASLTYLCRLVDPSPEIQAFLDDLRRYLANPRVKERIEDQE